MASRSEQALFAIHISQFRTPNFEFVSRFNGPYSRYHRLTTTHLDYVIYCPYPCVPRTLAPLVTNSSHVWLLCHSEYGLGLGFRSLTVTISGPVLLHVVSETGLVYTRVYTFITAKLQPLVTHPVGKNLIQVCLNAPHGTLPRTMHVGPPMGCS